MLTNDEVLYLLGLKKSLENNKKILVKNRKTRLELISPDDKNVKFWVELTRNEKILLKTSIHHLETNHHVGLLRIDYKGSHKNPEIVTDKVPEIVKPYAGLYIIEPHIHIYVEGYNDLAWAIPLNDDDFKIKILKDVYDIISLLTEFAKKINLEINQEIKIEIL